MSDLLKVTESVGGDSVLDQRAATALGHRPQCGWKAGPMGKGFYKLVPGGNRMDDSCFQVGISQRGGTQPKA